MDKVRQFFWKLSLLYIVISVGILTSCSKKQKEAKVSIQFDSKVFSSSPQNILAKPSAKNANGPNWGASDPTSFSDLGCFAIFASADEKGMNESSCTRPDGSLMMNFGPRAGFFAMNEPGEIFVPIGEKRTFYLLAMASIDGSCEDNFSKNTELNFANYSNPFLLGSATVDITAGDAEVPIQLSENFSGQNKLNSCDFIKPDADDTTGTQPTAPTSALLLNHHPSNGRSVWVGDNDLPRTVSFSYDAASALAVDCSLDGTNYSVANCSTPNSLIWLPANKANTHGIRITHQDGTVETETFIPDVQHGNVSFVDCDYEFDASNDFDNAVSTSLTGSVPFLTAIGNTGMVTCLNDNVIISDGSTTLDLTDQIATGVTLIARQGDSAKIAQTTANRDLILIGGGSAVTGIKIVGLHLEANGGGSYSTFRANSMADDILVDSCLIDSTFAAASTTAVHVNGGGSNGTPVRIINSHIKSNSNSAVYGFNPTTYIEIGNSTIESGYRNLHIGSGVVEVRMSGSSVINNGTTTTHALVNIFSGNTAFYFDNNLFVDNSGAGLLMTDLNVLNINNNRFRRGSAATAGHNTSFIKNPSGTITINSSHDGNSFCHEAPGAAAILSGFPIGGGGTYSGTYNPANQQNSGAVIDGSASGCP